MSMTLQAAQESRALVTICRSFGDGDAAMEEDQAYVLEVGDDYVLIAEIDGFRHDGFSIIRREDVARVKYTKYDKFRELVIQVEGHCLAPLPSGFPGPDSCREILEFFAETRSLVTLLRETDSDWWTNYSAVLKVKKKVVKVLDFSGTGKWEKKRTSLKMKKITRIRFGTDYLAHYQRHAPLPADRQG